MNYFKALPKLVINLPERSDRRDLFSAEMENIGNDSPIITIEGVRAVKPFKGIGKSHVKAMETGLISLDQAIIMEDDIHFPGGMETIPHINTCLKNAPDDWDILLGGVYQAADMVPVNEYWCSVRAFSGMHFYVISRQGYKKILQYKFNNHIDLWISDSRLKCFVMKRFCAIQHDGFSDNKGHITNYNKYLLAGFDILGM